MKYTYKKTNKYAKLSSPSRWKTWATVLITAVLFIISAVAAFPQYVEKTGLNLPDSWEVPFRLGLDLQGGTHLVYEAIMDEVPDGEQLDALEGVKDVVERRVNAFGVSEPVVQTTVAGNSYRVIIELAGVLDVNEAIQLIGETPILEFKELSIEEAREMTEEEAAELELARAADETAATEVLERARGGEDFASLVAEYSIDPMAVDSQGVLSGVTESHPVYGGLVVQIAETYTRAGRVVSELLKNDEGYNIVKVEAINEAEEMLLSHILVCFEGKTYCDSDRSALDASLIINNLKDQATADNFADLAIANSDDPGSAEAGGDLDWVVPGQMVAAFELAAAQIGAGEISEVVETDFGYHLIYKRDARTVDSYDLTRIVMNYTDVTDIVGTNSGWNNTELSGRHLSRASVQFDPNTGQPYVALSFNSEGDKLFAEITEANVGQRIAVFLDGDIITAPTVSEPIYGGQAIITGGFTVEEAKLLAQRLNAGALPVPLELMSQQTVGPTLGKISLEKSITAALIGFLFVALYMVAYYRLPGLFAVGALIIYAAFNLAVYKALDVTITLAGIAGFILSLGMAVDANVLIFERFREELKAGRDTMGAIDEGFRRAWTSIRDGNLTTLIAAAILFWFSTSFIKGFALTLSLGILLSMFTAITITRVWLKLISPWKVAKPLWLYGVRKKKQE